MTTTARDIMTEGAECIGEQEAVRRRKHRGALTLIRGWGSAGPAGLRW